MLKGWQLGVVWVLATLGFAGGAAYRQWTVVAARFEREASDLHRLVAQRVDQHDAHLTALSALIMAAHPPPTDALGAVAANILQFYPRLVAIDVIEFGAEQDLVFTTRASTNTAPRTAIAEAAARASAGAVLSPADGSRYLLVKRVPNPSAPRYAVALDVDTRRLVSAGNALQVDAVLLSAESGQSLYRSPSWTDEARWWQAQIDLRKPLPSASQPLELWLRRDVPYTTLLPWPILLALSISLAAALWLVDSIATARRAARAAEAAAERSAQEARLAQASRVNAMGELSLAIAHELTQPLAALLSQSQAGLRMIRTGSPDLAAIDGVLDANARHAKRAGDLLAKLRDWVSADPPAAQRTDLADTVAGMIALNTGDLETRGIRLTLVSATDVGSVSADRLAVEQIAQNLITNARDACVQARPPGTLIAIETFRDGPNVGFRIIDDGAGIASEVAEKLFEPFATSKSDGMGLGLSISRRLVERFGGSITGGARVDGRRGTVFTVLLPAVADYGG